jgi:hypothetical protein
VAPDAELAAPQLSENDRILGYRHLGLVGNWSAWVFRRVESIDYETATSVRRRVSVDLRLRAELFGEPVFRWGSPDEERLIHYVPIAQLNKDRLVRFDVRDEAGTALPVMTRRKNATIAAASLAAAAQVIVAQQIGARWRGTPISQLCVPRRLEDDFFRLAYLNPTGRRGSLDANGVMASMIGQPQSQTVPVGEWQWHQDQTTGMLVADVDDNIWRWALFNRAEFIRLASDVQRLFFVCVPLTAVENERRIVKFGYTEHLAEPEIRAVSGVKAAAVRIGIARRWNSFEDWLEGIPQVSGERDEWIPPLDDDRTDIPDPPSRKLQLARWIGWASKAVWLRVPSVGHGASYHLDLRAPSGIQVRRAELIAKEPDQDARQLDVVRGVNLRSVHLYTSDARPLETAKALVHMRPESAFILRASAIASVLTATALTLAYFFSTKILSSNVDHAEAATALLVLVPGLLSAYTARADEHPLATTMVIGLRLLAGSPGFLAAIMAALLITENGHSAASLVVWILCWISAGTLCIGWRLAARGRPHPAALT